MVAMQKLSAADMDGLRWTRTGTGHSYELKSGSDPIASIRWERPSETEATVEGSGVKWDLKRSGFLNPLAHVRDSETGKELGVLHVHMRTSLLQLTDGTAYRWVRTGFWIPAWEFQDGTGTELVDFEPVREEARLEGGLVGVSTKGRTDPNLLLLLVVGWYFIVQSWVEDEAVAASHAVLDAANRAVLDPPG